MSLNLESVRIFAKVAELASFSRAAEQLRIPKSAVSQHVARLEEQTGTALLHRTTRTVHTTADGEQFLVRASQLLAEADEVSTMFSSSANLRGRVRVDLPVNLARTAVIPRLPEFFAQQPHIELQVSATDRIVDVVAEGFDCVLRVGELADSDLIAIRLGELEMINCVSPEYVRKYGKPKRIADLDEHYIVHYSSRLGNAPPTFEYLEGARVRATRMRCLITVNNADAFQAACLAGLGIAQVPRTGVASAIATGDLIEVLPKAQAPSLPVSLLHPHGQRVPRRTRVVLEWLRSVLEPVVSPRVARPAR